jgi:hypothetical protein
VPRGIFAGTNYSALTFGNGWIVAASDPVDGLDSLRSPRPGMIDADGLFIGVTLSGTGAVWSRPAASLRRRKRVKERERPQGRSHHRQRQTQRSDEATGGLRRTNTEQARLVHLFSVSEQIH